MNRRTVVGTAAFFLAGGVGVRQYFDRHQLRFRPLQVVNFTSSTQTLEVTVDSGLSSERKVVEVTPATEGDRERTLEGPWEDQAARYSVSVSTDATNTDHEIDAATITDRIDGSPRAVDSASVRITLNEDGSVEFRVNAADD